MQTGTIDGKEFYERTKLVKKYLTPTIPAWSHVTLTNGGLFFRESNECEVNYVLPSLKYDGVTCVDYRDLSRVIPRKGQVRFTEGKNRINFNGEAEILTSEEYFSFASDLGIPECEAFALPEIRNQIFAAASKDSGRSLDTLQIHLERQEMMASDGHRLNCTAIECEKAEIYGRIPAIAMDITKSWTDLTCQFFTRLPVLDENGKALTGETRLAVLVGNEGVCTVMLPDVEPIDYEQVIPKNTQPVTFKRSQLLEALEAFKLFLGNNPRNKGLKFSNKDQTITAESEGQSLKKHIDMIGIPGLIFGVNLDYLTAVMKLNTDEQFVIGTNGNDPKEGYVTSPLLFVGKDITSVLMTMRIF